MTWVKIDEVEVEVNIQPTATRPICLGVRHPSGTRDQFFFLLEISFRQLRVCYFVAPSLIRGWVCNLLVQLLLGLARAVTLGSKSHRTHGHILLSHLRLPQPGGPGSRIYIPQEQCGPAIPQALGSLFVASYNLQGCSGGILTHLHTGLNGNKNEIHLLNPWRTNPIECTRGHKDICLYIVCLLGQHWIYMFPDLFSSPLHWSHVIQMSALSHIFKDCKR
jgi:hypothetical protein